MLSSLVCTVGGVLRRPFEHHFLCTGNYGKFQNILFPPLLLHRLPKQILGLYSIISNGVLQTFINIASAGNQND